MAHLSNDDKILLLLHYERILMKTGKIDVEFDSVQELQSHFNVGVHYASELRKKFLETKTLERASGSGRPSLEREERTEAIVQAIRERRNSTVRDIAGTTGIPKSSVQRLIKEDEMRLVNSHTVPLLTAVHYEKRLKFARLYRFNSWTSWVDLDEKWFNLYCPHKERYHDGSPRKVMPMQSKTNPQKLMIVSAVAKPNRLNNFSGLIGVWRVTKDHTALRSSKHHERGDVYPVDTTITADSYFEMITTLVIPAIRISMPWADTIVLQQDNAKPHIGKHNVERINDFGDSGSPNITLINQPPQSPEVNINDLGFFHSLSKRTQKYSYSNLDELWNNVQQSYWETSAETLYSLWEMKSKVLQDLVKGKGKAITIKHTD